MRSEGVLQKFSTQILQQVPFKVLQAQVCVGPPLSMQQALLAAAHVHVQFHTHAHSDSHLNSQISFLNPFVITP